jgi:putative ABC transport system ATP-binding protein
MARLIEIRDVNKWYGAGTNRLHVLRGVTLGIEAGEFAAIMGASGSGKSTLLNILGLMDGYDSGEYRLDGVLMKDLSETRSAIYRSRMVGFIFQSFNLIPFKTAAENVALPLYYQKVGRRTRNALAREYLAKVGLADRADRLPGELSGGQQQRVAIARALVARPKVILADEPTGALDSATSLEVVALLREVNRAGVTVIVVTHEREVALRTDRIIALRDGEISDDSRSHARA